MSVYFLSFFKAPSSIECEDFRKISWIAWDTLCLKKEHGGLGVRSLKEFALALLDKWGLENAR
jgi:hypothetical protein